MPAHQQLPQLKAMPLSSLLRRVSWLRSNTAWHSCQMLAESCSSCWWLLSRGNEMQKPLWHSRSSRPLPLRQPCCNCR